MKKIYIVLTYTGTVLSKIIKNWTKDEFSHVSISLDEDLNEMYSFGRINPYTPLYAGLVQEKKDEGTFKRFFKTKALIYSIEVEDYQYMKLRDILYTMYNNKKEYKFNILGLLAIGFKKQVKIHNYFYCAEFVKYVLDKSDINLNLPDKLIRPENFKDVIEKQIIYYGLLRKYNKKNVIQDYIETLRYRVVNQNK